MVWSRWKELVLSVTGGSWSGGRSSTPGRLLCLALAAIAVTVIFPDVLFLGGSLSPLDYDSNIADLQLEVPTVSVYGERPGRRSADGWGDIGSATFQMQPAQQFLAYCLRSGESPNWDPYSATGSMGPETLVDAKFSAVSVVTALLGAASSQLTFVLLLLYALGVFATLRLFTAHLGLSAMGGMAASGAFILNGFALMNLNTAIGQPYFLGPILLLSLVAFADQPSRARAILSVVAHALMFSVTFFPTMVLTTLTCHALALAYGLGRVRSRQGRLLLLAFHVAGPLLAVGLLSFLYLPVFDAYLHQVNTWSEYSHRVITPWSPVNLLSLFTPKHFWESYRAMEIQPSWPSLPIERWVPHLGIIASLVAASGLTRPNRLSALAWACLGLIVLALGVAFGLFPFTLVQSLPFFSFVRNEYWPALALLPFSVLVGLGFEALGPKSAFGLVGMAVWALIAGAFVFLGARLGFPQSAHTRLYVGVTVFLLVAGAAALVSIRATRSERARRILRLAVVTGLFAEGLFYMNTLHPVRTDRDRHLPESLAWVKENLATGHDRILNVGTTGIFPNWGSALQIPQLGTLNSGMVPSYGDFFYRHVGVGLFLSLPYPESTLTFTDDSLSLVGVRYVIAGREMTPAVERVQSLGYQAVHEDARRVIFENPHPFPRAFAVPALVASAGLPHELSLSARQVATTIDGKLRWDAWMLGISTEPRPQAQLSTGTVSVTSYHHDSVDLRASLPVPSVVVVTDSWHPNWRAEVDGKDVRVGIVDMTFRGIALPAGDHEIRLRYASNARIIGQALSLLTFVVLLTLAFWRREWKFGTVGVPDSLVTAHSSDDGR